MVLLSKPFYFLPDYLTWLLPCLPGGGEWLLYVLGTPPRTCPAWQGWSCYCLTTQWTGGGIYSLVGLNNILLGLSSGQTVVSRVNDALISQNIVYFN